MDRREKHTKLTKNGYFALSSQLNKLSRSRPSYNKWRVGQETKRNAE